MLNEQVQYHKAREFRIEVYNSVGEPQRVDLSGNTPDLSNLPQGFYTIRFQSGDDIYTHGIVKD